MFFTCHKRTVIWHALNRQLFSMLLTWIIYHKMIGFSRRLHVCILEHMNDFFGMSC